MTNIEVAKIMVSGMKCLLSREQIHELADILICRKFKKGERILDEGDVCRSMLYLEKGLTRQFYFKYDKDLTEHIAYEGGVVICLESYLKEEPTRLMIEALEPTIAWGIPKDKIEDYFETLYAQKYEMKFRLYFSDVKPKMAIFVSKLSHCLFDMLARYTAGEWNVEIPLIISNHPDLQHVAERFGIPFYLFPITKENKMEQEKAEMELLEQHNINFIVLARYMQVISEQMIEAYPNRIINIHHSFLPAFVGAKPYHAAFERGVKIIGATSHYVTSELDAGPIIEQDVVRITHKDTVQDLVSKGKDLEKIVLSRAVQKHIERKVLAYKNKTVIFS